MARRTRLAELGLAAPPLAEGEVAALAAELRRTRGLTRDFPGEYLARVVARERAAPPPRPPAAELWPLRRVQLEVVNVCNYRCPLCKTLERDGVVRRRMRPEEFARVLAPVKGSLERVILYGTRGEPLLHPELEACVAWVKAETGAAVSISTNGSRLTPARAEGLLEAGVDEILVAIDGLTPASYARYRVGGDLGVVTENLRALAAARDRLGAPAKVIVQLIPMRSNEAELEDLPAFGYGLGADEVRVKLSGSVSRSRAHRPVDPALQPAPPADGVLRCPFGLDKVYVDPSGDVFPCCYTEGYPGMRLGNALETPLDELWDSDALWELRRSFVEQHGFHGFCRKTCQGKPTRTRRTLPRPAGVEV